MLSNLVDLAQKPNCTRFLTVTGFSKYLGINLTKSTNYTNCQFDQRRETLSNLIKHRSPHFPQYCKEKINIIVGGFYLLSYCLL